MRISAWVWMASKNKNNLLTLCLQASEKMKRFHKSLRPLLLHKGVGELRALILLHLFLRCPDANQLQIFFSLAGLGSVIRESGSSINGRTKISKAGDRIYKGALFMPSMVTIDIMPNSKPNYERLKTSGKHATAAQVAAMRNLLVIAHSLHKNGEVHGCIRKNVSYSEKIFGRVVMFFWKF